ncbi:MAG: hypothetical protein C4523_03765 [Myxococcales bacterium]|nr:MAG: hypothetical protein C4523_03765 [Myxococcales bacterium]
MGKGFDHRRRRFLFLNGILLPVGLFIQVRFVGRLRVQVAVFHAAARITISYIPLWTVASGASTHRPALPRRAIHRRALAGVILHFLGLAAVGVGISRGLGSGLTGG